MTEGRPVGAPPSAIACVDNEPRTRARPPPVFPKAHPDGSDPPKRRRPQREPTHDVVAYGINSKQGALTKTK